MSGRIGRPVGAEMHDHLTAHIRAAGQEIVSSLVEKQHEDVAYLVPVSAETTHEQAIAGLIAFAQRPPSSKHSHDVAVLLFDNKTSVDMPHYLAIEIADPEAYAKVVAQKLEHRFV